MNRPQSPSKPQPEALTAIGPLNQPQDIPVAVQPPEGLLGSDLGDGQPSAASSWGEGLNYGGDRIGMGHEEVEIAGGALHDA